jgi:hypothetical protein
MPTFARLFDDETNGRYTYANRLNGLNGLNRLNGLNGLNELAHLCLGELKEFLLLNCRTPHEETRDAKVA